MVGLLQRHPDQSTSDPQRGDANSFDARQEGSRGQVLDSSRSGVPPRRGGSLGRWGVSSAGDFGRKQPNPLFKHPEHELQRPWQGRDDWLHRRGGFGGARRFHRGKRVRRRLQKLRYAVQRARPFHGDRRDRSSHRRTQLRPPRWRDRSLGWLSYDPDVLRGCLKRLQKRRMAWTTRWRQRRRSEENLTPNPSPRRRGEPESGGREHPIQ